MFNLLKMTTKYSSYFIVGTDNMLPFFFLGSFLTNVLPETLQLCCYFEMKCIVVNKQKTITGASNNNNKKIQPDVTIIHQWCQGIWKI